MNELLFEWNEAKNLLNFRQHGISFDEARDAFYDPFGEVFYDEEHSRSEDRFLLLACDLKLRVLVVVYQFKEPENSIRIISARRAEIAERRAYEENV